MKKVLYVEDEMFLGKIVKESLESRGFEVLMVSDGSQVMDQFDKWKPDICVLDIMLPGRDGLSIAREIRGKDKSIPLIFLTAKVQTEDVLKGFKEGGNDYLKKPFSLEELIVRMQNLLAMRSAPSAGAGDGNQIQIGRFSYNLPRQLLTGGLEERKLSHRESELLLFLYRHRNTLIERRELLNAIWGNDSFFNSRNLDVYITKLRGYLKEDPSLEILTIKGVGYRFVT